MLRSTTIALAVASDAATTAVEMDTSPTLPGTTALILLIMKTAASLTPVVEHSDDNSNWSNVFAPGALTSSEPYVSIMSAEVTIKKYMRVNCGAYTDGTLDAYVLNAG
ncbi:MAG: hypothetical protein V3S17_06700 [candidate division Zixibacteria bacterium]